MKKSWLLPAVIALSCAHRTGAQDEGPCAVTDNACHNAAWQRQPEARRSQDMMWAERKKELARERAREREATRREAAAAARQSAKKLDALRREAALAARAGWWCFEGDAGGKPFGQCRSSKAKCIHLRRQRAKQGVSMSGSCQPFIQAACFNATVSLKKGARTFCFPQPAACTRYREQALARGFVGVSNCGALD